MAINVVSTRAKSSAKAMIPVPAAFPATPEVVGSMLRWYKPLEGITTDGSGRVSVLNDFSGLGLNATEPTFANQPTVSPSGAVNFSAPSKTLPMPVVHLDPVKGYSIFFVGEVTGDCHIMGVTGSNSQFRVGQEGLRTLSMYSPTLGNPQTADLGHTPSIGLYGARVLGTEVHFLFNRAESIQPAGQVTMTYNSLNHSFTTGSFLMHELLLVDKYVSNTELADLITYFNLAHNMGI